MGRPRKELQSPESLKRIASQLDLVSLDLRSEAQKIESHGWPSVLVDNDGKRSQGMDMLMAYRDSVQKAVKNRMEKEGLFRAAEKE